MKHGRTAWRTVLRNSAAPIAAVLLLCLASSPRALAQDKSAKASGQGAAAEKSMASSDDLMTRRYATGDWWGERSELADKGVSFVLTYNQQLMVHFSGGVDSENGHILSGSYEFNTILDLEKMDLVPGATIFIRAAKGTWRTGDMGFNAGKIGSLSRPNGDEASNVAVYVEKYWWRQRLLDNRIEFRIGNLATGKDLFDRSSIAGSEDVYFMNNWLAVNPTIPHRLGLGAYLNLWPTDWLYVKGAFVDPDSARTVSGYETTFDGVHRYVGMAEVGVKPDLLWLDDIRFLPGEYKVGGWYNPGTKTNYDRGNALQTGDEGIYVGLQQTLYRENPGDMKDKQGLAVFARYGYADGDVNRLEHFWSAGAQYIGAIPTRDKDVAAFGIAQGISSGEFKRFVNATADQETVYELYYAIHVTPWMVITPDLQFITNAGGFDASNDAFMGGLRMRVQF